MSTFGVVGLTAQCRQHCGWLHERRGRRQALGAESIHGRCDGTVGAHDDRRRGQELRFVEST